MAVVGMALLAPAVAQAQGERPSKRCDFTDPAVCLYPWPNDHYTERDPSTPTGRRLALGAQVDAGQQGRRAHRPRRHEPGRRLQPRLDAADQGARARDGGGRPRQPAAADRGRFPKPGEALAGGRDQRPHRQAASRLGRDRLQPEDRGRPCAHHPAGEELHRGRALHRRPAQSQARRRERDSRGAGLPPVPRRDADAPPGDRAAPAALRAPVPEAPQGEGAARQSVPGLGLHRGQPPQPQRPGPAHPRPGLRRAGRREPA